MLGPRDRTPPRRRLFAILLALVTALLAGAGMGACSSSSSSGVPPTTGILIRAETLTAGHGCGPGPTQLFKYAVVVHSLNPTLVGLDAEGSRASYDFPLTGNVFDCFADGVFLSLPSTAGNSTFRLEVYAYNAQAYAGTDSGSTSAQAEIERAASTADANSLRKNTTPTWTTECTATQQENVQALANCDPLLPGLSGLGGPSLGTKISLQTAKFVLPGGRLATCATASTEDAGVDASVDAGPDADLPDGATDDASAPEAGAPVDAGAPVTFTTVRIRPRTNATIVGPTVDLPCPTAYVTDVTPEPAIYQLDVALLDSAGNLVSPDAQTVCTVTSQTGTTSSAVCP